VSKSNSKLNFLAALSGLLIAMQARANGELSLRMGNPIEAALVSFGSGFN
jgi:transporter family-2 protein